MGKDEAVDESEVDREMQYFKNGINIAKRHVKKRFNFNCMKQDVSFAHASVFNALCDDDLICKQAYYFKKLGDKKQKELSKTVLEFLEDGDNSHCKWFLKTISALNFYVACHGNDHKPTSTLLRFIVGTLETRHNLAVLGEEASDAESETSEYSANFDYNSESFGRFKKEHMLKLIKNARDGKNESKAEDVDEDESNSEDEHERERVAASNSMESTKSFPALYSGGSVYTFDDCVTNNYMFCVNYQENNDTASGTINANPDTGFLATVKSIFGGT